VWRSAHGVLTTTPWQFQVPVNAVAPAPPKFFPANVPLDGTFPFNDTMLSSTIVLPA
jgi:hypothetical protein